VKVAEGKKHQFGGGKAALNIPCWHFATGWTISYWTFNPDNYYGEFHN
jgi:hypothetical protein